MCLCFALWLAAISGCATLPNVRGEWTGETYLRTAVYSPQQKTMAVYFTTDYPVGRFSYRGGFLVDEKRHMVSHRYAGRRLRVRGTIKSAGAIDGTTGLNYEAVMMPDGKPAPCMVLVVREKDIVDVSPTR
jgi:hypothetical protein